MHFRVATVADAEQISSLIRGLSGSFLLAQDGSGAELFLNSIDEKAIRGYLSASNFWYRVAEADNKVVGLVALRDNTHLYHLFVAKTYQGQGLGRSLWLLAKHSALQPGHSGRFTVNSSLNAVHVYERFGFVATGTKVEKNGVAFVPMQWVVGNGGA